MMEFLKALLHQYVLDVAFVKSCKLIEEITSYAVYQTYNPYNWLNNQQDLASLSSYPPSILALPYILVLI